MTYHDHHLYDPLKRMSKGLGDTKPNVHRGYMIQSGSAQLVLSWTDDITWGIPPRMRLIWQNHIFRPRQASSGFPILNLHDFHRSHFGKHQVKWFSHPVWSMTQHPLIPGFLRNVAEVPRPPDEKVTILMWLIENFWRTDTETKKVTRNIAKCKDASYWMYMMQRWHWHWNNFRDKTAETWNLLTSTVLPYSTFPTCIDFWILQNEAFWWWCRWKASYRYKSTFKNKIQPFAVVWQGWKTPRSFCLDAAWEISQIAPTKCAFWWRRQSFFPWEALHSMFAFQNISWKTTNKA